MKDSNQESDFYAELGKDLIKATLITVVTVLVRSLSDILTSSHHHDQY